MDGRRVGSADETLPEGGRSFAPSPRLDYYSRPNSKHSRIPDLFMLTSKQRAHLRSLAHSLKPVLHVGTDGVTGSVVSAAVESFNTRELVKVKVHDGAPADVDEAADALSDAIPGAHVVQTIGHIAVLYRPDPDEPEIVLPS